MSHTFFRPFLRWTLPLLAASLLITGCGGSGDSPAMDAAIAEGNAAQIRKAYAALTSKSLNATTIQAAAEVQLDSFTAEALAAVNLARSQARSCGDKSFPAVGPLSWNARAAYAALLESEWMLDSNSFGHVWPTGELVWDRLELSGYRWSKADENIAAGYRNLPGAMKAWIDSPPHCVALMRADITEVAIAVVPGREGGAFLSYWTMVLATPQ